MTGYGSIGSAIEAMKKGAIVPEGLPADDQPDNIWAPEIHWDPLKHDYFILFASTTPRERNDEDDSNNNGKRGSQYDNRMFVTRTKDFRTFTDAKLFFDRGFACIDAVMRRDEAIQRWAMVIKCSRDETLKTMPGRNLWLTFTGLDLDHPHFSPLEGPIAGNHSPMFSDPAPRKSMAEGPSHLPHQGRWLLAWDEPAGGGMQLANSPDLKTWIHLKSATFPWATRKSVWAERRELTGGERIQAQAVQSAISCRYYVRYDISILVKDRLVDGSMTLEILAINEIGRKKGHELVCGTI